MKFLRLLLTAALLLVGPTIALADEKIEDDFSSNTDLWQYEYAADRDSSHDYVVLTPEDNNQRGVMWLNEEMTLPLKVQFRYKAGTEDEDDTPADGFTFMFLKQKKDDPETGGDLAFGSGQGYGIEFDSYSGVNDLPTGHIALIKDSVENHLVTRSDERVADNEWHDVEIEITENQVKVNVDDENVLNWNGTLTTTYHGIGFSAATGGLSASHIIDDVVITNDDKEDVTAPQISVNIKEGAKLGNTGTYSLKVSAKDEESGMKSLKTYLDGDAISNTEKINLDDLTLGEHKLYIEAIDNADNKATKTITFSTSEDEESLCYLLNIVYFENYAIDNKGIYTSLRTKLLKGNLIPFINELRAQSGKHINAEFAQLLITNANFQNVKKHNKYKIKQEKKYEAKHTKLEEDERAEHAKFKKVKKQKKYKNK